MALSGRRSMLTKETTRKVVEALRAGNYRETAAQYAGIGKATFFEWMSKGRQYQEKGEPEHYKKYAEFADSVEKAMADSEVEDVALIKKASRKQWQAAAWMLERKFPNKWGRRDHVELTGKDGGPVEISAREKLSSRLEEMAARKKGNDDDNY